MPKRVTMPVSTLIDLYIKANQKVQVYWTIKDGEKGRPIAWEVQKGQVIGKLYSWIDIQDPIAGQNNKYMYLSFWGTEHTNNKKFYVKVKRQTFDWSFVQSQLDAQRRSNMNWYDRWFDDLEKQLADYEKSLTSAVYGGLGVAAVLVAGFFAVKYVIFPELQVRRIERGVTKAIREAKR